jgi:hypothetical protein
MLLLAQVGSSMILKKGESIDKAAKALNKEMHQEDQKYKETEYPMISLKKGSDLRFWKVDVGLLVLQYSKDAGIVEDLEYNLYGPGPRAQQVTFRFTVISFDTVTGQMVLETHSPKESFQMSEEEQRIWSDRAIKRLKEIEQEKDAEQAVPSDGHKPSSRVPSDGPTAPADAH